MIWLTFVPKIIPLVIQAVHIVELLKGDKKGKDKQDAALEGIKEAIKAVEFGLDKDILDEEEFQKLLRRLIDDYVAIQNFIAKFKK